MISTEFPEFAALAQMSGVDVAKMQAAFADPVKFFEHLTLDDLQKIRESCARFALLQGELQNALDSYAAYARGFLDGHQAE